MNNTNNIEMEFNQIRISPNNFRDNFSKMIYFETHEQVKQSIQKLIIDAKTPEQLKDIIKSYIEIIRTDDKSWERIDRVKVIFNELDDNISGKLNSKLNFRGVLEQVMDEYFGCILQFLENHVKKEFNSDSFKIVTCLFNIPMLLDIKAGNESVLYPLAKFLQHFFKKFNTIYHFQLIGIQLVLNSNHKLMNYLAVTSTSATNNPNMPLNPNNIIALSRGLSEAIFIYSTIKSNLIGLIYNNPEVISQALTILEQRSRFFGMTADAIPENVNLGDYIVVDTMNAPLEDDDVYEEYEKFLSELPNNNQ